MKTFLTAAISGLALLGLAACSDNADNTTTQSVEPAPQDTAPLDAPSASPDRAPAPLKPGEEGMNEGTSSQ